MFALDILKNARAKLADFDHWIRHDFALDDDGKSVPSNSPRAVCWCSVGALYSAADIDEDDAIEASVKAEQILVRAATELFPDRIRGHMGVVPNFNDHPSTTHGDVLAVYDRAILIAEHE